MQKDIRAAPKAGRAMNGHDDGLPPPADDANISVVGFVERQKFVVSVGVFSGVSCIYCSWCSKTRS